jgi:putative toxin-antitoxin system antitoxin component (TIGR02293 family)
LRRRLRRPFDVHEAIEEGLPGAALVHLYDQFPVLHSPDVFERVLGMSLRTFQRLKLAPRKPLSREQSGRTWQVAEILAKAIEVFGSQEEAETWLARPAIALEQRRPIDLLATPPGMKLVEDLLGRIEYGVYT